MTKAQAAIRKPCLNLRANCQPQASLCKAAFHHLPSPRPTELGARLLQQVALKQHRASYLSTAQSALARPATQGAAQRPALETCEGEGPVRSNLGHQTLGWPAGQLAGGPEAAAFSSRSGSHPPEVSVSHGVNMEKPSLNENDWLGGSLGSHGNVHSHPKPECPTNSPRIILRAVIWLVFSFFQLPALVPWQFPSHHKLGRFGSFSGSADSSPKKPQADS